MSTLALGNTIYTRPVAKVMISVPDELLKRIDTCAKGAGETRSGFLQRLAERELEVAERRDRDEVERLLNEIGPLELGADIAQLIREDRESH
jgi:hypothetical protein